MDRNTLLRLVLSIRIIQGGMGIAASGWKLAKAFAGIMGCMGVVSGTAIADVFIRRLADGDPSGDLRRALRHFPYQHLVTPILKRFFIEGGKGDKPYPHIPQFSGVENPLLISVTMLANFCEVWLAKEGHDGIIGINYLEKVQPPHIWSLFGAMLADVDVVLMGAGIPLQIPDILDALSEWKVAQYRLAVEKRSDGRKGSTHSIVFDPNSILLETDERVSLKKPLFFPIISLHNLGELMEKKTDGRIDGYVVEAASKTAGVITMPAGGHNAPPRRSKKFNKNCEPVYDKHDLPDMKRLRALGKPFWLAGYYASREKLKWARKQGACGVQIGTIASYCRESGFPLSLKRKLWRRAWDGKLVVTTSLGSPTGYPFKVAALERTLSHWSTRAKWKKECTLGYLRVFYERTDGTLGSRCSAEPVTKFVRKGGLSQEAQGKVCLCRSLMATIGLNPDDAPIITSGDDTSFVCRPKLSGKGRRYPRRYNWTARKVVRDMTKSW